MNILVTGGTSTIGKHLNKLIPNATFISTRDCDLTNYNSTLHTFNTSKPDVIIHLAALVGGILDNVLRPVDYLEQNILINTNTIRAAHKVGVNKLIAIASTCVYPDTVNTYPMKEDAMFLGPPPITNFEYAYSKRCMIAQIQAYNKQYKTEYCYIIPSNLYSELDNHRNQKAHFVTSLLHKIKEAESSGNKTITLIGTGKSLRQFTYAADVASIVKLMVEGGIYESFNVSNPENYTVHELAMLTLKSLGKEDYNIVYTDSELDGQYRKDVSIEKLQGIFPTFCFTSFANGIKKVYSLL